MSLNREMPHLLIIPEDRANAEMANGFVLGPGVDRRRIQVVREAGGWLEVVKRFKDTYVPHLHRYPAGFVVLLIDFDGQAKRFREVQDEIPDALADRVFILGALTEPEDLKAPGKSLETVGEELARDCQTDNTVFWENDLLKHNSQELIRLKSSVSKFLFDITGLS
jgi:hypothetical protein